MSFLERCLTFAHDGQLWFIRAYRIGKMMAQGAYLLSERKRLFAKLGEEVYAKFLSGELRHPSLEASVHQLDRLTKKIEIEEMLIRSIKTGSRPSRSKSSADANSPGPSRPASSP